MIYICTLDQTIGQERLIGQLDNLPLQRPEKELKDRYWESFRQRIIGWLLLGYGLKTEGFPTLQELDIERGEYGKPYSRLYPELYFNISHCSKGCACVISEQSCGIDIERRFSYRENLARKVSHVKEWEAYFSDASGKTEEEKRIKLQQMWSVKEAFVKRDGRGISYGMEQINLLQTDLQNCIIKQTAEYTVAAWYSGKNRKIQQVSEDMLLNYIREGQKNEQAGIS